MHSLTPPLVLATYTEPSWFRNQAGLTCRGGFAENSGVFAETRSPGSGYLVRSLARVLRALCSTDTGC
jgi:hypothetical protein